MPRFASTLLRFTACLSLALAWASASPGSAAADASDQPRNCIHIDRVTTFAPRGEVYIELSSSCTEVDFALEDPILAHVEVLVGDHSPASEDVRVYGSAPRQRETLVFRDLDFIQNDLVLVRLIRFGEILGLQSVKVP